MVHYRYLPLSHSVFRSFRFDRPYTDNQLFSKANVYPRMKFLFAPTIFVTLTLLLLLRTTTSVTSNMSSKGALDPPFNARRAPMVEDDHLLSTSTAASNTVTALSHRFLRRHPRRLGSCQTENTINGDGEISNNVVNCNDGGDGSNVVIIIGAVIGCIGTILGACITSYCCGWCGFKKQNP